jgi:hypothetical protein
MRKNLTKLFIIKLNIINLQIIISFLNIIKLCIA